jgi:hypothetical protein
MDSSFGTPNDSQAKMQAPKSNNRPSLRTSRSKEATLERKEAFYSELVGVLAGIPKRDVAQMMDDFNARVESANDNFEHIMGNHKVGTMNENWNLFVELCRNHSLKIGGTLFPHKKNLVFHLVFRVFDRIRDPLLIAEKTNFGSFRTHLINFRLQIEI